ncbi:hypothetical protein [Actinoallomurus acanthiterrae]
MLLPLTGCGGGTKSRQEAQPPAAASPNTTTTAPGANEQSAAPAACPTKATRKFAKTRFITSAGLAAGTFKRYIYTPFKTGAFQAGAPKRKRSIAKAGIAAVFAFDQLRRAKANAQADPTLCKVLIGPIDKLSSSMHDLAGKLKGGTADPGEIDGVGSGIEGLRKDAGGAGAGFQDKTPPASAVGG